MNTEEVRSEVRALIESWHTFQPYEVESLSDEITTLVIADAMPGEVRLIESIEALAGGFACNFQKSTLMAIPKFERAAFFSTGPARALIPWPIASALAAVTA